MLMQNPRNIKVLSTSGNGIDIINKVLYSLIRNKIK